VAIVYKHETSKVNVNQQAFGELYNVSGMIS